MSTLFQQAYEDAIKEAETYGTQTYWIEKTIKEEGNPIVTTPDYKTILNKDLSQVDSTFWSAYADKLQSVYGTSPTAEITGNNWLFPALLVGGLVLIFGVMK
jgi:hypothetical protein